jgi:anti-sigma factor RsiW
MDRKNKHSESPLGCQECRDGLQDYLDGTLEKTRSLQFFLHLRDCPACQTEHDNLQALFGMLDALPQHEVPEDFDAKILASVPYEAYRAMEPIRRERVPVYLAEEFLPAVVRAPGTRIAGVSVALVGVVLGQTMDGMSTVSAISLLGLVPEFLVRLQGVGRRAALAVRRSEG